MFKLFKYFWMIAQFKQVSQAYKESEGKDKPKYLTRRFLGAAVLAAGVGLLKLWDITIPESELNQIADYLTMVLGGGYGLTQLVVGIWKREKKKRNVA